MARKFLSISWIYLLAGLLLGIYMAASKDHGQLPTHAHIMLVGFLLNFAYGLTYKLCLQNGVQAGKLAKGQFILHQIGALVMVAGLFLLYGGSAPEATLGPILGISSIFVLLSAAIMAYQYFKHA
ncbi:hypothetical protein [Thiomicrorhabdus sp. 6S3-12]|uniref:hypothetical protein n=1 Tax=Thiomicrorhabdus sp. 6S3-12 TaxID=2819681 RepID=UPI001AAE138B|nr:hypothetical protein [Thiomicrorhabdus sp. 6S3-12]MBO1924844.1 hypothetical protein [Thiomicrorhabdus sp. 6S3-12]